MEDLKECPICHCRARWWLHKSRRLVWIECTNNRSHRSKAYLVNDNGAEKAMRNWNHWEEMEEERRLKENAGTDRGGRSGNE